jgi:hypothetical protein
MTYWFIMYYTLWHVAEYLIILIHRTVQYEVVVCKYGVDLFSSSQRTCSAD